MSPALLARLYAGRKVLLHGAVSPTIGRGENQGKAPGPVEVAFISQAAARQPLKAAHSPTTHVTGAVAALLLLTVRTQSFRTASSLATQTEVQTVLQFILGAGLTDATSTHGRPKGPWITVLTPTPIRFSTGMMTTGFRVMALNELTLFIVVMLYRAGPVRCSASLQHLPARQHIAGPVPTSVSKPCTTVVHICHDRSQPFPLGSCTNHHYYHPGTCMSVHQHPYSLRTTRQ